MYGIRFDYTKCFDLVPHSILLPLIAKMGLPYASEAKLSFSQAIMI